MLELVNTPAQADLVQLGRGIPDIDAPTLKPLLRSLSRPEPAPGLRELSYGSLAGEVLLREQVARAWRWIPGQIAPTT